MSGDTEPTTAGHGSGPVFVDGTGRRGKRVKRAAYVAASACAAYMAVVGVSLAAHQETTLFALPGTGVVAAGDPESAGILDAQRVADLGTGRSATRSTVPLGVALARVLAPLATTGTPAAVVPALAVAPPVGPVVPVVPPAVPPVVVPVTTVPPPADPGTTAPPPNTEGGGDPAPTDPPGGSDPVDPPSPDPVDPPPPVTQEPPVTQPPPPVTSDPPPPPVTLPPTSDPASTSTVPATDAP